MEQGEVGSIGGLSRYRRDDHRARCEETGLALTLWFYGGSKATLCSLQVGLLSRQMSPNLLPQYKTNLQAISLLSCLVIQADRTTGLRIFFSKKSL